MKALSLLPPTLLLVLVTSSFVGAFARSGSRIFKRDLEPSYDFESLNRSIFPPDFLFGTASSAYQYEGAAFEEGKGPSSWDTFTHKHPEKIQGRGNGDVALDFYHRYKEDVKIMKNMGWDSFRFSISWSRLLPHGKLSKGVNKKGVQFYHKFIDELVANGIKPFVTLFHWDSPQALEDEYGGFLSPKIADDFRDFAELCFKEYGDKVKNWITLNEPWSYIGGYSDGHLAPGRCSKSVSSNCTGGNSGTEPYLVAHHSLLAHSAAVEVYRQKYQKAQKGVIGITLIAHWMVPYTNARHNVNAASRALDFMLGWFMDPITSGDYPYSMRTLVGNRLPQFTKDQSRKLRGSFDFLGLNYYTAQYAHYNPNFYNATRTYFTDQIADITGERDGKLIGRESAAGWLWVYPRGFYDLLLHIKRNYNNPIIYITENGYCEPNNEKLQLNDALRDLERIDYHHRHITYLHKAMRDGVNVRGYFIWSLLDNFEWNDGYTVRFGIHYVDYKNGLKRFPKLSAEWFKSFLLKKD